MKTSSPLPVWVVCLGCCLFVLASGRTAPVDAAADDLDTAVYDNSEVVEARVVGWPSRGSKAAAEVELTAVYKGDLKPGQIITMVSTLIIDRFYVEYRSYGSQRSFERGDELFLFLNPHRTGPSENLPADRSYHNLGRVKLVRGNQVLAFKYFEMPIRLEPTQPQPGDIPPPSVEEYRQAIARCIPEMEKLRERFACKPSVKDRTWLLELLRQHLPQQRDDYDTLDGSAKTDEIRDEARQVVANLYR